MPDTILTLLGPEIAGPTGPKIWGLDEEGELNGIFRPTGHSGLWYASAGFPDCRNLSKYLVSIFMWNAHIYDGV